MSVIQNPVFLRGPYACSAGGVNTSRKENVAGGQIFATFFQILTQP